MQILLYVLAAVLGIYILFVLAPSVVMFLFVFGRKQCSADHSKVDNGRYEKEQLEAEEFFVTVPSEDITLKTADGITLRAKLYKNDTRMTAIMMHGYIASPMLNFSILARDLYRLGFSILMPYQRAHGESGGKHCCLGLAEQYDLIGWTEMMLGRGDEQILLCGVSMGCATAAYASDKITDSRVRGMILDCGFLSPYEQLRNDGARRHLPWKLILPHLTLFGKLFLKVDIHSQTGDSLEKTHIPAFFMHGTADLTVPAEDTLKNAGRCSSEHELLIAEGAGHTTAYYAEGSEAKERIKKFIVKYFNIKE